MGRSEEILYIYHTNDIHSHFDSWPQITRYLASQKRIHEVMQETSFRFDIGDHVDRSHPFTEGTSGKGNVALLNRAQYDAVTIGNNEGITLSKKALNTLYKGADFDVILCNLSDSDGFVPKWINRYKIYHTENGMRVGVIGATAMYTEFYSKLGWHIEEPRSALKKLAQEILQEVDMIVCLSHMGVHEDRLLAEECNYIDVILGAHTHHLFIEGEMVEDTLLAATGKFGEYVGCVEIRFDKRQRKILNKSASVIHVRDLPWDEEDNQEVQTLLQAGNEAMEEKIFYNLSPLQQELFGPSALSSFFGAALLSYTEADCAMFNAGIFLGSLETGWVTKRHLHTLLPHPINPCVITLDGTELLEVYALSANPEWPEIEIKGLGFRGTIMGSMMYEGLYMNKKGELIAGGRIVRPGEIFTLATLDMFTFGYFFPLLKDARKEYLMPELIRDIIAWYGKKQVMESMGLIDSDE